MRRSANCDTGGCYECSADVQWGQGRRDMMRRAAAKSERLKWIFRDENVFEMKSRLDLINNMNHKKYIVIKDTAMEMISNGWQG